MKFLRRFLRDRCGTEVLEAAVTVPILVLLTLAILQFGTVVYASQMAKEAARHGARMGSVAQDNPAGRAAAAAYQYAQGVFPAGNPEVQILAPGGVVGSELRIRVRYRVPNFVGGFPGIPPGPYDVWGEATARQEGW